jgi:predicted proteasome-type protease
VTFCLGMNVHEGLVGLADTRVLSGSECITARKVTTYQHDGQALFVMTSGLRSLRDKAITYFDEVMTEEDPSFDRLFKDVDFPVDIVLYEKNSYRIVEHNFGKDDLLDMTSWWQERLRGAVHDLPLRCD